MKKILIVLLLMFSVQTCCSAMSSEDALRYNQYYNNGVTLFKAEKYSSALYAFKKVLRVKPYDNTVRNALISTYVARADFYANKSNEPKKALNDLKSAYFYMKYWNNENVNTDVKLSSDILGNIKFLESRISGASNHSQRFEGAKILRMQGELPAAGYDFNQLFNNSTYSKKSLETAGDIYKSLNNNLEAINCYRRLINTDPKNASAHFKYALILDEINNSDTAAEEFNLALKYGEKNVEILDNLESLWLSRITQNPNDAQAYINLGAIFQKKGDYASAKTQYLKAQTIDPNDKTVLYNLASLYLEQNSYISAAAIYDSILAKEPNNKEVILYKAQALEHGKNFKGAIAAYKTIIALDPNGSEGKDAKVQIARIVNQNYQGSDLLSYLELEANSNPLDFNMQYDYAYQLHKAGQFDKAIKYYKNALNINPKYTEGYINLSQLYINRNDYHNAQAILDWGLNMLPDNSQLNSQKESIKKAQAGDLYNIANKYWDEKNYKAALENYLKIPIQTPEVLNAVAGCYFELNNYQKALEYYKNALGKSPNNIDSLEGTASTYLELNDVEQSKIYLNKIIVLEPNNLQAKSALNAIQQEENNKEFDLALALFEKGDYANALGSFNNITLKDPKNAYAHYYKALIYDEQKKLNEAVINYKKAISLDSKFTLAYYGLAIALDTQEKYSEAVQNYDKYLALRTGEKTDDYITYVKNRTLELKKYLKK